MRYNYSVIIPFRDKMDLLKKAVDSIPDREDVQIIIVDNSAISMKSYFCSNHYKSKIDYLRSNPEKGAGHARNKGIDYVEGRWILFLDADDFYSPNAFVYFDKYVNSSYDIVFFNVKGVDLLTGNFCNRASYISKRIVSGDEDMMRYRSAPPYCKMIRKTLIEEHNIRFQESRVSNDVRFSYLIGYYADKVRLDNSVAYYVTEAPEGASLTKQRTSENRFIRFQVAVDANVFLESIGRKDLRSRLIVAIVYAIKFHGFKECFKYLKYALHNRQNIFTGRSD